MPIIETMGAAMRRGGTALTFEDYQEALSALEFARERLVHAAPNRRDYYPLIDGEKMWEQAQSEHWLRLHALDSLIADYQALLGYAYDEEEKRAGIVERSNAALAVRAKHNRAAAQVRNAAIVRGRDPESGQ